MSMTGEHAPIAALRTFTIAEGIVMIVLGSLALIFPVVASFWVTAVVALAFLVGGIVGLVDNLYRARHLSRRHAFARLVVSTLFLVTGAWMISQFRGGLGNAASQVASLALAIGVVFVIEGLVAIAVAASHKQAVGRGWGLANGLITLLLGVLILTMKFWSQLSVIGVLVGVSFLFSGIDLLAFSAHLHGPGDGKDSAPSALRETNEANPRT
ncbi:MULTISPECIES: HdeD family acid-resistance protein [unclassified Synechococcus]|uniref:HdeD family acid-resistance protein n=2 Tax=Synechococcales TaxID=1890424 RepID=UPI0008FF28C1|nr:hypothetical protein BM449_03000 [Synechococcus sp. SynAce01]TWB96555.1 uncharacterized membrane protein HdeD (DUF308 family) [Synechococcus sp. Ace-Pa]